MSYTRLSRADCACESSTWLYTCPDYACRFPPSLNMLCSCIQLVTISC